MDPWQRKWCHPCTTIHTPNLIIKIILDSADFALDFSYVAYQRVKQKVIEAENTDAADAYYSDTKVE